MLFPRLLAFGQAVRAFFYQTLFFSLILSQVYKGDLIKHVIKLHGQVAHDLIVNLIVDHQLTYFCIYMYAVVLKLPIL